MKRKPLLFLFLTHLLTCAVFAACGPAPTGPEAQATPTAEVPTLTPAPTLASPHTPAPTPVIPASFDSFEDLTAIFDYDREASLNVDLDPGGVTVHEVSYASPMGGRVTGYLVVPPGEGPFAGIIFMHGAGGSRSQFLSEAVTLARTGAVALLVDGPAARPEPWQREFDLSDLEDYRTVIIQAIIDLRCAADVLASHPDVDAERIGFVGHSYGAILGGVLAGVEHRIKAYVLMAGYPRFIDAVPPDRRTEEYAQTMDPLDPIRYIGHAAPAALFFQFGMHDTSIPPELTLEYVDAASEPKLARWYHAGHMLDTQAFYDRAEWLATQIGLDITVLAERYAEE